MKKIFAYTYIAFTGALAACSNHANTYSPNITTVASPKGTVAFQPDSASIAQHYQEPEWFRDAKFGIFIRCLHTAVNGMPASCIKKVATSINITKKRMAS